jgi:ATP-binding cassette, subfamily G (WHITE), member 2, SNQ2
LASERYKNNGWKALKLVTQRELLLWWRDKYQIKAKIVQTLIMSVVIGTLFFNAEPESIVSVMFQAMFFTTVGVMVFVTRQFSERAIFYKHQDANFFPPWCFVVGRLVSTIPSAAIDAIGYGTIVYFLVGLAYNDGASIANYFIFVLMMFIASMTSALFFSIFSACIATVTVAQSCMAISAIIFIVFSGFTFSYTGLLYLDLLHELFFVDVPSYDVKRIQKW